MPLSQVEEIWIALHMIQEATIDDLAEATGWTRHVVEVTMRLLLEKGMARRINITNDEAEPIYEVIGRREGLP